ncbi:hypothetical protein MVEN_00955600 [Mycena venus]|uniref:Uncharacterized protein n=1 Tax=Mycena venus TaxID=2733690 RepID=A0A8H6YDA7_9AGAR|nr:hypothetical protein MVEN_00955600 [Mycena venus]
MGSDTQPLLADTEANLHHPSSAASPQTEHLCTRCSAQLGSKDYNQSTITWRLVLMLVAIFLCASVFSLLVAQMADQGQASVSGVFATIWTDVTVTVLAILLYMGRRPGRWLGRTPVQVHVLCALGFSWILLIVGMIPENHYQCIWSGTSCGLFTTAHVLTWFLAIALFGAAYATYRRAVKIHGATMVPDPSPPMVAAWRLANVGDNEGAIKI